MSIMDSAPKYRLHSALGYQLTLTARSVERPVDEGLRALGISRIIWCILLAIGNDNLTQPSEIADFIGVDRTATSRALRQMETAGLINRQTGRADRRTTRVTLANPGADMLRRATPLAVASAERMAKRLNKAERAQLLHLLRKARNQDDAPLPSL